MTSLQIHLFGFPRYTMNGETEIDLRSNKARALLAYLSVESTQAHSRQQLVGLLWPEYTESSARTNLRRALADLRESIGDRQDATPHLVINRESVQLNLASDIWVDVVTFEELLKLVASPRPGKKPNQPNSPADLEKAVDLYQAPFLEGFSIPGSSAFEEWMLITRERLHRLALQALYQLTVASKEQGSYDTAISYAWRQLEIDPWQENAHRQVMELLALDGQRAAAAAQYDTCSKLLKAELGVNPSEQTQQLYEAIVSGAWPPKQLLNTQAKASESKAFGECPYRGLAAFGEQDASVYFGREDFSARLIQHIRHSTTLPVLIGTSGSGKSSVIFAGVVAKLRKEGGWLIVSFRPGGSPFQALSAALIHFLENDISETDRFIKAHQLAAALSAQELSLNEVVQRILEKNQPTCQMLIAIDQFEELYTLCREPETRQKFLRFILESAIARDSSSVRPNLLLSLRADFLGQALAYRPFSSILQDGLLLLEPMTGDQLKAVIEKPAEKSGAVFEPGLVKRILDDVGDEPGNLPLLEFALTLLWEKQSAGILTHTCYDEIGQVKGALARYAEQVFCQLEPIDQEATRQVFMQLVRPGVGTEDTRRSASRQEIGEPNWAMVQFLADRRLVVTGFDEVNRTETTEIIHETLIQSWSRLQGWLESDRSFRIWQEELRGAIRQWQSSHQDEGSLLRGKTLALAEKWFSERELEISPVEIDFIQTSVDSRQRKEAEREAQIQRELATERRSRRLLALLAAVLGAAMLISLVLIGYSLRQQRRTLEAYSLSLAANAQQALDDLDSATGLALALAANRISDPPRQAQRILMDAAFAQGARWREQAAALFPGSTSPVTALEIAPDGQTVLSGMDDGTIIYWEINSKKEIMRLTGHSARVNAVSYHPDGDKALSGGSDGQVILWDLTSGKILHHFSGHSGTVRSVDVSPDGYLAVSGGFSGNNMLDPGELFLWDLETGEEIRRFVGHKAGIVSSEFKPDGHAILASSGDTEIFSDLLSETPERGYVAFDMILWDINTGEPLMRFANLNDDAFCLAISPDGTQALAGSFYNKSAVLWDLSTGEAVQTLEDHREGVRALVFSPDGKRALTGSADNTLVLWDLASGKPLARLKVHSDDVLDLAISPDGRYAISSGRDGSLIYWDLVDAQEIQRLSGHGDMVYAVAITPDGQLALSSSGSAAPSLPVMDASIRLWEISTGFQLNTATIPVSVIFKVAISPNGRTVLLGTEQPAIIIWDLASWQEIGRLEGHQSSVPSIEFLPDGKRALSLEVDGTMILWDVQAQQPIRRIITGGQGLWSLAINPDGGTALSDSANSSMVLWDLETGQELRKFVRAEPLSDFGSSCVVYFPDGRRAISCEQDGYFIEWDLQTGEEIRRFGPQASLRNRLSISPDGIMAVSSGLDGSLMSWDSQSGELIRRTEGHGGIFNNALAPDGKSVFFGSSDRTIVQWELINPSLEELQRWITANRYVRALTCEEQAVFQISAIDSDKCATGPNSP